MLKQQRGLPSLEGYRSPVQAHSDGLTLPGHFTASTQVCGVQVTDTPGQSLKGWQDPEGRGCEESNAEAGVPLGTGLGSGTPWLWDLTQIPSPFPASVPAEWRATAERTRSRRLQFLNLQLWDPGPPLPTNRTLRLELGSSLTGTGQGCWGQAAWESWALPSHQAGPERSPGPGSSDGAALPASPWWPACLPASPRGPWPTPVTSKQRTQKCVKLRPLTFKARVWITLTSLQSHSWKYPESSGERITIF